MVVIKIAEDMRYYETFYAVHVNDWRINFGNFSNHQKILVKEYINTGCSTTDYTDASETNEFIYPQHIKKTYFIEGVIFGHITLAAQSGTSTITSYRITVCKIHENNERSELFTTGWVTVSDTLAWDGTYNIGEEMVYPFWIDAWEYAELEEKEKIYIKIEVNCNANTVLWHSNNATWQDIKIEIPFRL